MAGVRAGAAFLALMLLSPVAAQAGGVLVAGGICPEARRTKEAPPADLGRSNPIPQTRDHLERGRRLYFEDARPTPCRLCHGAGGRGNGRLSQGLTPPPRNFTCGDTMHKLSDGQLFWIIRNGSPGTGMPAHKHTLKDEDIWRLILYIRRFAAPENG